MVNSIQILGKKFNFLTEMLLTVCKIPHFLLHNFMCALHGTELY